MTDDIIISAKKVSKKYALYNSKSSFLKEIISLSRKKYHSEHRALDDVSFEVKRGDCFAIIGKNGSGKSTLLKIIAGLLKPTSGYINVKGKVSALVQLGATFNPEFTGLDNVNLYAAALGYSPQEIKKKLPEILDFADIGDFVYQKVKVYSSGMRARLAFSVVISLEPEILIVDEVLSVGDMFFKQKCINKLKLMIERGLTLFFVSHSLSDVKSLCQSALYLEKGKVVACGDVSEVTNLYQNRNSESSKKTPKRSSRKVGYDAPELPSNFDESYICPNLSRSTERSGDKKIAYFKISLINENMAECNKVHIFENIKVRAYFSLFDEISSTTDLGLVCRDARGYDIFTMNSVDYNLDLSKLVQGERYVWEIDIPKNLLSPGVYTLNIGAKPDKSGNIFYDRIFTACVFEVLLTDEMHSHKKTVHGCFFCEAKMRLE